MAIITINTAKRSVNPGVFNVKQYLNGTETITWELSENTTNDGEVTLDDYDAFLVLSENGIIDEVMLTKQKQNGFLRVLWNVGTYATERTGYVKYQIVFRSSQFDTLGVLSDNAAIRGVYNLVDKNTFNTNRVFKKSNGHVIKWDATNLRWGLYNGSELLDYQKVANEEPQCGMWNSVAVGNTEAAAWFSHEAVMQVSESIGADQSVTAGFPTILRQLWARMAKSGVTSVNDKTGDVTIYASDIGASELGHTHDYLPLKGGKLSGTLDMGGNPILNVRDIEFEPRGDGSGNYIDFHFNGDVDYTSRIRETASGKLEITALNGLAVNGKTVALSVNGAKADSAGNITIAAVDQANKDGNGNVISATYVKKAGDTMTGTLSMGGNALLNLRQMEFDPGSYIDFHYTDGVDYTSRIMESASGKIKITANNGVEMTGSVTTSGNFKVTGSYNGLEGVGTKNAVFVGAEGGAGIVLYGREYSNNNVAPGQVTIYVTNGTQTQYLTAKPDGTFTWRGQKIITDAGGTFNGNILFSNNAIIKQEKANGSISVYGGSTTDNGSALFLYGHDYGSGAAGRFILRAANLEGRSDLVGYVGGNITWREKKVLTEDDVTGSKTADGWTKLPNGLYLMWGQCYTSSGTLISTKNFPLPFPNQPFSIVLTAYVDTNHSDLPVAKVTSFGATSFNFSGTQNSKFFWVAIGF